MALGQAQGKERSNCGLPHRHCRVTTFGLRAACALKVVRIAPQLLFLYRKMWYCTRKFLQQIELGELAGGEGVLLGVVFLHSGREFLSWVAQRSRRKEDMNQFPLGGLGDLCERFLWLWPKGEPAAAGELCRRFTAADVEKLMDAINEAPIRCRWAWELAGACPTRQTGHNRESAFRTWASAGMIACDGQVPVRVKRARGGRRIEKCLPGYG